MKRKIWIVNSPTINTLIILSNLTNSKDRVIFVGKPIFSGSFTLGKRTVINKIFSNIAGTSEILLPSNVKIDNEDLYKSVKHHKKTIRIKYPKFNRVDIDDEVLTEFKIGISNSKNADYCNMTISVNDIPETIVWDLDQLVDYLTYDRV